VFRLRHEASFEAPVTVVYKALLTVLARRRWAHEPWFDARRHPSVGQRYAMRNGPVVRHGRVVECLRPVLLTLHETLFDPPCRVQMRLRSRLEPLDLVTVLRLDTRYELNRPATLNRRRWREEIDAHCRRLQQATDAALLDAVGQGVGCNGQSIGNSTMTVRNTTSVNGTPSFK
jgi:hypothetical protein